jgi:hypothetical protein
MNHKIKQTIILLGLTITLFGCGTEHMDAAVENGAHKLSGHEIRKLLTGSTVKSSGYGDEAEIKYLDSGKLSAKNMDKDKDVGLWSVDDQERLCLKFRKWGQGDKICYWIYQDGEKYKQFNKSGLLTYTFTVTEHGANFQEQYDNDRMRGITYSEKEGITTPQSIHSGSKSATVKTKISVPLPPASPADLRFITRKTARNCPGCNLAHAQLSGANLLNANLEGANLAGADLSAAILRHANLRGANLYKASLRGANLSGADLTGANLTGTDLTDTNLAGAAGI